MATKTDTAPAAPAKQETTAAEDIRSLADVIVALIRTPEFNAMTWPEIDAALQFVSHDIKLAWRENGTVSA